MKNALVSVVIPCYNVEKYLQEAVESVVHQTYRNIEVILVDDGSTDGTSGLCDYFADQYKNIRVIHKKNGGLSSARNAGMADAKGEYIYFLDSDDYIKEEAIECLVNKMEENGIDVVFFGSCDVNEQGTVVDSDKWKLTKDSKVYRGIEAYELFLREGFYAACVQYYFYRRDFLTLCELQFTNGIIHEDEFFSFEVYHYVQKIMADSNQYYFQRMRGGSIMSSNNNLEKKFESTVWITDTVTSSTFLAQFSKEESRNILLFLQRILDLMCGRFNEVSWQQKRIWGKKYRRSLRKYIGLAIMQNQLANVQLYIKRYILSMYAWIKR